MPLSIKTYLNEYHSEEMPGWLRDYTKGSGFNRDDFFGSRLVYYPGYFDDGQPVKLFGGGHAAHVFVYVDYGVTREDLIERLESEQQRFKGYQTYDRVELSQADLAPGGWRPTIPDLSSRRVPSTTKKGTPYGFVEILERDPGLDDEHGPERLAILFLGADGFATYDALFCQPDSIGRPFAILLQDHGFGGNYDNFGADGLLYRIATKAGVLPKFLLTADDGTQVWPGYDRIEDVKPDVGGMHGVARSLYSAAE